MNHFFTTLLLVALAKEYAAIDCRIARRLSSSPKADIYIVDLNHIITKKFYEYAQCWLDKGILEEYSNKTDYSHMKGKQIEFVLTKETYNKSTFNESQFDQSVAMTIVVLCPADNCNEDPKIRKFFTGFRMVQVYSNTRFRDTFATIITREELDKNDSQRWITFDEVAGISMAIRMGVMCFLAFIFCITSVCLCCHSLFLFSMVHEDYNWRRENMEAAGFQEVPLVEENHPLRSPAATPLQTAMSRTSMTSQKSLDSTQDSRTEKPSLVSFG